MTAATPQDPTRERHRGADPVPQPAPGENFSETAIWQPVLPARMHVDRHRGPIIGLVPSVAPRYIRHWVDRTDLRWVRWVRRVRWVEHHPRPWQRDECQRPTGCAANLIEQHVEGACFATRRDLLAGYGQGKSLRGRDLRGHQGITSDRVALDRPFPLPERRCVQRRIPGTYFEKGYDFLSRCKQRLAPHDLRQRTECASKLLDHHLARGRDDRTFQNLVDGDRDVGIDCIGAVRASHDADHVSCEDDVGKPGQLRDRPARCDVRHDRRRHSEQPQEVQGERNMSYERELSHNNPDPTQRKSADTKRQND